ILAIGRADARRVEGAERGTPWADVEAAAGRAPRWSVTGLALLGVGAALGVASLVWGLGSRRDRRAQLSLSPAGVSLQGSF
ncbi:MAG: hypothetical protein KF901_29875, partial [Myxococcales bacterium]|nr:hypothetical protein [Myxococcales bacterium]